MTLLLQPPELPSLKSIPLPQHKRKPILLLIVDSDTKQVRREIP
jgi:hypothetical protein